MAEGQENPSRNDDSARAQPGDAEAPATPAAKDDAARVAAESADKTSKPAGKTSKPAGKTSKSADRASEPAGKPASAVGDIRPPAPANADGSAGKDEPAGPDKPDSKNKPDSKDLSDKKDKLGVPEKAAVVAVRNSSGRWVTKALRHANPVRAARSAGRTTSAWAKRPTGRLLVPVIVAVLLVVGAATAGAYVVPAAMESPPPPSATPEFGAEASQQAPSGAAAPPTVSAPAAPPSLPGVPASAPAATGGRPADALAGWAQTVGTKSGIPVVAVQAYGYAERVLAHTTPSCHLSWTTIAAIGKVESGHGSTGGAVLGADGVVQPTILSLPLNGKGGRELIRDTDQGTLDGDTTYDRAVGPLQFIPQTWKTVAVDADNSGTADPNDIDDASLAAADYLCQGGRDLAKADAWWDAILSYNAVSPYAQKVFDAADEYGRLSRS
ncbi:lytic transglycosylase domain-containing protein [Mangrovihabitans endophyticus]|uniref:Transglycosylase SLT domain-containing protein n=1 Tax=Mangrovihabitans endophyticus TaxID=1751298 RepID=A0A8J3BW73_9ACTN|nr:lytic murein transglycosylase [Mangrovihabitans endophyticus]GGK83351.1 hypothetical protein GCM10012284_16810 [Mangrovihabitans endophyticus]